MTSTKIFFTFAAAFIIVQCSGSRIPDTEKNLKNVATLTERVPSVTEVHRQQIGQNITRQNFGQPCSCDQACQEGTCVVVDTALVGRVGPICADESYLQINFGELVDISSVECSGVCIAANMLGEFATHELIFEKHVHARVLCDDAGSCATKGHIVNYKGKGMMMGSYCDIVGCQEKVMPVNSPRYSRGLKVESKSEDMRFTAFAARFETRGEEAVLATAVRVGL